MICLDDFDFMSKLRRLYARPDVSGSYRQVVAFVERMRALDRRGVSYNYTMLAREMGLTVDDDPALRRRRFLAKYWPEMVKFPPGAGAFSPDDVEDAQRGRHE